MDNLNDLNQSQGSRSNQILHDIRFRCPSCEKLYRTQSDVFHGAMGEKLPQPEFDCQNCQKTFSLTGQTNSFGLYETVSLDPNFASCPKCTHLMPTGAKECPSCGIFVDKYEQKIAKEESPTLFEINQLWQAVVENFNNDQNHQNFLNFCQKKMALNFAFQKYDELRKSLGYDDLCEKYLKQIEIRLERQFMAKVREDVTAPKKTRSFFGQWIFAIIGFIGLALLIFNKIRPTFPNLTGLVVSITLLSFMLWLFSSQKSVEGNNKNLKI